MKSIKHVLLSVILIMLCAGGAYGGEKKVYTVFDESTGIVTYYYDDQMDSRSGIKEEYNATKEGSEHFIIYGWKIKKAVLDESMKDARLTNTKYMFGVSYNTGLSSLEEIEGLENLNTSEVTNMDRMFAYCKSLKSLDLSHFNTSKVTSMASMFEMCQSLESLDLSSFNTSNVTSMMGMFSGCKSLTSINLSSFNTANVTDMKYMFYECSSLTSIDVINFNTANVTSMENMFYQCENLASLDLRYFDIQKVKSTERMFSLCFSLTTIYCNDDWSSSATLTKSEHMFDIAIVGEKGTSSMIERVFDKSYARPDGGKEAPGYFTTKKTGKYVYTLFDEKAHELTYYYDDQYYNEVERPGIIAFYEPTSMRFDGYNNKVFSIVIDESMKEAELTSTAKMFFELTNASKIEGLENLVTDEVTNMSSMFWACEILSDLDLTSFNTSNVTNMTAMFQYCYNMQTLDLSSFDLSNLDRAREMFSHCGVKTIYCTQDLSAQSLKEKNNMFSYSSVVGGKGTVLDSRYESNEYARPDGGVERPGYFTLPTEEALIDGVNYLLDNKTLTAEVIALPEGKYEEEVLIPEKVKYFVKEYTVTGIGDEAFKDCDGLTSLTLESTTPLEVGEDAFEGVPADITVNVPAEAKEAYSSSPDWKDFTAIQMMPLIIDGICYELDPNTYYAKVVALPQGKYKGNIVLPEEVTFEGVKYKVGQIGKGAFARCGELESLSLPATINEIEDMAIVGNPRLISINVAELNLKYSDKEGVLFNASGNTLLIYPTGRYGGYSVPEGTKRIEHHAFIGADLKMMFLPESLEEIGSFAFDQTSLLWMGIKANTPPAADDMAFYGVNNMIPIYVADESIDAYKEAKEWKEFSNIVKGIVRNVSIGDLIYDLYRWDKTAEVVGTVEDNPTGMIEIPEQIEVAFELAGVPARRTDAAHMPQGGEPTPSSVKYRVVSIGNEAFYLKIRLGGVTIPGSVKTIGEYAFYGCTKLSFAHFNEGLEEVKDCAFAKCLNIHNWDFPTSLVTIGSHAFAGSAVEDLYIPDNVQYIHGYAFLDCRDLKWAEIGEGVRFMGDCVFKNCTELLALYMNGPMPPSVGKNMFHEAGKIQTIYAPCGALERYQEAWKDYAKYIKNEEFSLWYTITAEPSEHGTILVPMTDCNHNMVAIPDKGYHFVEWSDGNTENPRELERPTSNISYGAVFEANIYKWEVDANNADWGYVSTPRVEKEYPHGTEMTAIAVPKDGYKFIKWSNGKQITPFNFTLEKDTFLRAIFIEEDKEPEIPQFTMQVTSAEIKWWKKDDAFFYSLAVYLDEAMTNLFATFLFDKNGYIVDVVLPTQAPRRAMKEEQETEFQYTISGLSADTKYYYRMETRDESERLIYTDEGEFRTLTTEVYTVIARIDAIGEVELTDQCGSRIESAREAYDALSEENKALVTNYETLVADEKQYAELKKAAEATALADAKEQLAATLIELQAVKALAGQYEAVDIETAVTDAIIAANAILNSDVVTLQEVYAANATAQSELTTALMDLLDMAKKQLDDALSALLEEGDSEACQQIIAEAIEAVDLLEIDWTKTVEANATDIATNGQAIYDQALADLEAQRKAEQEPTGLEQTSTNDEWQMKNFHATKVMENGVLYLLHEGRMYDVRGERVR